jgi:hypothetical protein
MRDVHFRKLNWGRGGQAEASPRMPNTRVPDLLLQIMACSLMWNPNCGHKVEASTGRDRYCKINSASVRVLQGSQLCRKQPVSLYDDVCV